ncbi:hypothetical protein KQ306_01330 [Synechococcus sp. CS-1324]|uniref:hypothetical protein n=1 Tax=Synechococcus sp. CS-1324 TaxID=2847980 RepID=UPI000DB1E6CA|nr:hypothetical protein [Synechococcus sp. CS-1324]MCT0229505.1 hypothetical protein [Synechococcus sp. CS-1324]PZV04885.1 MAG: hypothetical protein DCF23_05085 [Cyanobium sp.]
MTKLLIFGATTPAGDAFLRQAMTLQPGLQPSPELSVAGRRPPPDHPGLPFLPCELSSEAAAASAWPDRSQATGPLVVVSFAPIWHLAPFLNRQLAAQPPPGLRGVVACSSSSVLTKRFASNGFDRALVGRLQRAEAELQASCKRHGLACQILQPTLIYGRSGSYADRNLSRLATALGRYPWLPVPDPSGLRQPIHCAQLAAAALHLALAQLRDDQGLDLPSHLPIGGDDTLSYRAMLERLAPATGRTNRLLPVPARLIYALAAPLLLVSPKRFEAVLRMGADLCGFLPVHELLGRPPAAFPAGPLAP